MPSHQTTYEYEPAPEIESVLKEQYPYRTMHPEEYVARNAHNIGCFGIWRWKYRDPVFAAWLLGVYENLHDRARLEACRDRFLTVEESKRVRELAQGEF